MNNKKFTRTFLSSASFASAVDVAAGSAVGLLAAVPAAAAAMSAPSPCGPAAAVASEWRQAVACGTAA